MPPSTVVPFPISVAVQRVRSRLQAASQATLSERQAASVRDVPAKGSAVVSKVLLAAPVEDDTRQALFRAIERLGTGEEKIDLPRTVDVEAEWTGYERPDHRIDTFPDMSEKDKYSKIVRTASSQITILYLHGGAF